MPAANPMNVYAPETSQREMPVPLRSDDIHHAINAMIAPLASATALTDGNTSGTLTRSKKKMGGTAMANKSIVDATCGQWA